MAKCDKKNESIRIWLYFGAVWCVRVAKVDGVQLMCIHVGTRWTTVWWGAIATTTIHIYFIVDARLSAFFSPLFHIISKLISFVLLLDENQTAEKPSNFNWMWNHLNDSFEIHFFFVWLYCTTIQNEQKSKFYEFQRLQCLERRGNEWKSMIFMFETTTTTTAILMCSINDKNVDREIEVIC